MEISMIVRRHLLPAGLSAAAAAGVAELSSQIGKLGGKVFITGLRAGPCAILGAISGIFYSTIYDLLPQRAGLQTLRNHAIAAIGSAVATYAIAFAAATGGLFAMPSIASLALLSAAAVIANIVSRAIFAGRHPRQTPADAKPQPNQPEQPKQPVQQPGQVAQAGQPKGPQVKPSEAVQRWIWPSDLSLIKINASEKQNLDSYLESIRSDLAKGNIPDFHRKGDFFFYKDKFWKLPRTVSFAEDPKTQRVSAILLSVENSPLGKGRDRTPKVIYNLTTGERMCKKKAQSDYELDLMKSLNGSKGIESLPYIRKVTDKRFRSKTQLITPLYKGDLQKLFKEEGPLSAKDVKGMMLSLLRGLEKLHSHPGKGVFPAYTSYHSDIKPANLLYNRNDKGYDAVISDVETVNDVRRLWGTLGWMSPGKVQYWGNHRGNVEQYNMTHSQSDDIWSMGLVFVTLLKNQVHELRFGLSVARVAPLNCIIRRCQNFGFQEIFDREIANLNQREIDDEIGEHKRKAEGRARQNMWDIVQRMLSVDSHGRITAKQAREELEAISV